MAKLEGNSLKFTTLPPRNRCFSLLINKAACIPLIHLPVLLIVKISTVLLLLLSLLSTFFIHRLQLKFFPYPFLNQKKKRTKEPHEFLLKGLLIVAGTRHYNLLLTSHSLPPALGDVCIRW